ncbi:MAG: BTAD domain-containing putative transcriptional regulator [Anaerofustis sp.]
MAEINIKIQLLGRFEILQNDRQVLDKVSQSKKTRDLLAYLILQKNRAVPHAELFENLWAEDENANPESSLRTLLYRYRSLLEAEQVDILRDSVKTGRGMYRWNSELGCRIDVFEFEDLCKEGISAELCDQRLLACQKALALYRGDLLPMSSGEPWVIPKSVYYHELYLKNVFQLIQLLKEKEDNEQIIDVCQKALNIDLFEDCLHIELIQALMRSGKNKAALQQYQATSDIYYKQLGVAPSENIRSMYKHIIRIGQDMETDIVKIQQNIETEDEPEGAFVCEYEVFKRIYHLQCRQMERTGGSMFISLMTVNNATDSVFDPESVDVIMNKLLDVAQNSLRRSDMIARYSSLQYVIMLPRVTYETGKIVMERIKVAFYKRYSKQPIVVTYKLKPMARVKNQPISVLFEENAI